MNEWLENVMHAVQYTDVPCLNPRGNASSRRHRDVHGGYPRPVGAAVGEPWVTGRVWHAVVATVDGPAAARHAITTL